jgi:DNA polymerase-3 subunit beta
LQKSIKKVAILADKTKSQVVFDKKGSSLTVLSEDKDYNNLAVETLTISGQGDDLKIGFNTRFLNELFSHLHCEIVKIEMSKPNRAGIITPMGGKDENESILILVMPVMINDSVY